MLNHIYKVKNQGNTIVKLSPRNKQLVITLDLSGLDEVKLGGAICVLGGIFFKLDGRASRVQAVWWHLFMARPAFTRYYTVLTYLILTPSPEMVAAAVDTQPPASWVWSTYT